MHLQDSGKVIMRHKAFELFFVSGHKKIIRDTESNFSGGRFPSLGDSAEASGTGWGSLQGPREAAK